MRNRLTIATAALLLAVAGRAGAQQTPPPAPAPTPPLGALTGSIDFGARITSASGDAARYERYRDLRDGASSPSTDENWPPRSRVPPSLPTRSPGAVWPAGCFSAGGV